jgi:hypothetical protein
MGEKETDDMFLLHAALIVRQDGCTVGDARMRAWREGPHGYACRVDKEERRHEL